VTQRLCGRSTGIARSDGARTDPGPPERMVLAVRIDRLETARMRGEPIGAAHRDALIALLADPRVGATLGRRVMEKLGFAFERDTLYAGLSHVLYRRFSASSARSTSRSVV
jgi:hypothetical protein